MSKQLVIWLLLFCAAVLVPGSAAAQLAPTGAHYAGRASDTGYAGPSESGGYAASIPLDLPTARGGLPLPLQIVSGSKGYGAAGVGWDIPLSFVLVDDSFGHRRPAMAPNALPAPRERITVSLLGRRTEMLPKGSQWIGRYATDLSMHRAGSTWIVADGNGVTYTFTPHPLFAGTGGHLPSTGGLWLLDSIAGRGGAVVKLHYEVLSVDISNWPDSPSPAISIDLIGLSYNPGPTPDCFKHDVTLNYDSIALGAHPQSVAIIGERVLARMHKLMSVVVSSRGSCGDVPQRLRRYSLSYLIDPDTQQSKLESVKVSGREGTPEANVSIPVATYHYATASTLSAGARVLRYEPSQPIALPPGASPAIAKTSRIAMPQFPWPTGSEYAALQSLTDFSGDGRPDLVFASNGKLWISAGVNGGAFGTVAQLNDNTFTRPVLDTRWSEVDRFSGYLGHEIHRDYVWTQSIDVNGDGRMDIIDAAEQPDTWVLYLNTPDAGPSGIKWIRRTLDVARLHAELTDRGLVDNPSYLPLSQRATGRSYQQWTCWTEQDGHYVPGPSTACPAPYQTLYTQPQQTFVEYELKDVNGDGYPDLIFNSNPVGWTAEDPPTPGHPALLLARHFDLGLGMSNGIRAFFNVTGLFVSNATDPFSRWIELIQVSGCGVQKWVGQDNKDLSGNIIDRVQSETCSITDVNGDGIPDRIEGNDYLLGTGHGFKTVRLHFPVNRSPVVQRSDFVDACFVAQGSESTARQANGLRDLTGDGIPDFVARKTTTAEKFEVFVGTGAGFTETPMDIEGSFSFSKVVERCDGTSSETVSGLFDVNGDGRPDVVTFGSSGLFVSQLAGGIQPGNVEAGKIVGVDNGYGATTSITYASAKDDLDTRHQVPFPEIVVASTRTTGSKNLGGTLASTSYAYGDIDMFYDSTLDVFRPTGYRRSVELVSASDSPDSATQNAKIVDRYPLDEVNLINLPSLSDVQRFGRYLRAGRVSDVTILGGSLGASARALLGIDVTTDSHRISGVHYSVNTLDTHLFSDTTVPANDVCKDVMFPYDFALSQANNIAGYNPCISRGFLYTSSTQTWRGTAAPPSTANVQTSTSVRSIDDYGRVTSMFYQNDAFRGDDDVCVDTTYAAPLDLDKPVLTAVASRQVWACGKDNAVLAREAWEYDQQFPGLVSQGLPTSHTVFRYTADTGHYLGWVREFDASYDAFGNPVKIASAREDGGKRTIQLSYDLFGLSAETSTVYGTTGPALGSTQLNDPISSDVLETKDENGTVRGTIYDGFGRPLLDTISTPDDPAPGVLAARSYLGFDGVDPLGRRVSVKEFTDRVEPTAVGSATGHVSTTYLDELGRSRFGQVELGDDYASETMIVGLRTYDPLGRVAFEADAFPKSQGSATAYGTSRYFDVDGSLMVEIRGAGPQAYTTTPSASLERFPTVYRHGFVNHVESKVVQTADALTVGLQQYGVTREAAVTAIGRVLSRSTWQSGVRLEHEALGYDQLGQFSSLVRYQNAAGASNPVTFSMQLDSLGQILFLNEPSSAPQERMYSDWGQLKTVTWYPQSPEPIHGIAMAYDELGRLTYSEEQNDGTSEPGTERKYKYDVPESSPFVSPTNLVGRLSSATTLEGTVVLSYDGNGRVDSRTFTDDRQATYFEQHKFHGDGSEAAIELRLPDNSYKSERLDYAYDTAGRLRWMWFSDGSNTQELYNATNVDAWGRTRNASYGLTDYSAHYADLGRRLPQSIKVSSSNGTRGIAYTGFDPLGRELSRQEDLPNSAGQLIQSYDPLGRLQGTRRMQGTTTTAFWTFAYDALGNVASLNDQLGTADATLSYLTTDRDQICGIAYGASPGSCNVDHDSFGNIVNEPTRTGYNKLAYFNSGDVREIKNEAGITATFQYDAFGDVSDLSIFKGSTELRHDRHFGAYIAERSQKSPQASTLYLSRQFPGPGLAVSRRGPTGPWIYEFAESHGTRFTTDEKGNFVQDLSYTPFGEATSSGAVAGSREFTNEQWNEGDALDGFGLVRLGARLYDPAIGRFLSRDPLMIPRTAATTNPYAFSLNDPINMSDPSGLDPCGGSQNCLWSSNGGDISSFGFAGVLAIGAALIGEFYEDVATQAFFDGVQVADPLPTLDNLFAPAASWASVHIGPRIAGTMKVASGAAGFLAGAALCSTIVGCLIGAPLGAGSLDVAGSGFLQQLTGDHHATLAETIHPFLGQLEEAGVNAAGLAQYAVNVRAPLGGGPAMPTSELAGGSIRDINAFAKGTENCANCAVATDALLAGRPASALPGGITTIGQVNLALGKPYLTPWFPAAGAKGLVTVANNAGPGARFIVYASRGSNVVGHYFNVVNQDGFVRLLDGQIGGVAKTDGYTGFYMIRTN